MSSNNHYIMIVRDDRYLFVGPFETYLASVEWGHKHGAGPSDDPRWQTIQLADACAIPTIVRPEHVDMDALDDEVWVSSSGVQTKVGEMPEGRLRSALRIILRERRRRAGATELVRLMDTHSRT